MTTRSDRDREGLSSRVEDTSTWGKRLEIKAGVNFGAPGVFSASPESARFKRLVDVRADTLAPGIASRDVTAYIVATQTYENNPPTRGQTIAADQASAFAGLYGRLETGRGGVSSFEDFIIPAHGKSIHIGADTSRLSIGVFPDRAGWNTVPNNFQGELAAGFSIVAGVTTALLLPDEVTQFYNIAVGGSQSFDIPRFSRTFQFVSDQPLGYTFAWIDAVGNTIATAPSTAVPYVGQNVPIPIDAVTLLMDQPAGVVTVINPLFFWRRES